MEHYDPTNPGILGTAARRKKKKKTPKIVAYLSCSAGRTHFAETKKSKGDGKEDDREREKKTEEERRR